MQMHELAAAVLRAVSSQPGAFGAKPELLHKAALDIVAAQFKHKTFSLERLRQVSTALGRDCFIAVLEELPAPLLATLLGKIDKANKGRLDDGRFVLGQVTALGLGEIEPQPVAKAPKTAKPKAKAGEAAPVRLLHQSKVLGRKV